MGLESGRNGFLRRLPQLDPITIGIDDTGELLRSREDTRIRLPNKVDNPEVV